MQWQEDGVQEAYGSTCTQTLVSVVLAECFEKALTQRMTSDGNLLGAKPGDSGIHGCQDACCRP